MQPTRQTKSGTKKSSNGRKLSEVTKHLVIPSGITSTGWPAVRDTCKNMGVEFDLWQDGLGRLVTAKRKDGMYAAGIGGVIISICRQVGKTFTIGAIIFALCIIFPRLTVIWTAHHSRTSDETFESLQSFAGRKKVKPFVRRVRRANGQQQIIFTNGSRIMFGARENGFGRGFAGVDVVVMDEFQILTNKALEDMIPATNASPNPLIIGMGTPPRPVDPGDAFRTRRNEALAIKKLVESGVAAESEMLYIEVGADQNAGLDDWTQIEKANPSYPHRVNRQAILRVRKNLADDDSYRREGLGIWDDDRDTARAISESRWEAGFVDEAPEGAPTYGIAFSADGMRMALAAATADGEDVFVELLDSDEGALDDGMVRLAKWFAAKDENGIARWRRSRGIVIAGSANAPNLVQLLLREKVALKWITQANAPQVFAACQVLDNELKANTVSHPAVGQERLDASIASVMKQSRGKQGSWAWAPTTSDGDETPTEAISFALWGARTTKLSARTAPAGGGGSIL